MQKDLEQLLRKVEDRSMSENEMRDLRSRLEDTEAQMTRILQQMHTAQNHSLSEPVQQTSKQQPSQTRKEAALPSDSENGNLLIESCVTFSGQRLPYLYYFLYVGYICRSNSSSICNRVFSYSIARLKSRFVFADEFGDASSELINTESDTADTCVTHRAGYVATQN